MACRVIIVPTKLTKVNKAIGTEYDPDSYGIARRGANRELTMYRLDWMDFWTEDVRARKEDGYYYGAERESCEVCPYPC